MKIEAVFEPRGAVARALGTQYEPRPAQIEMAGAIAQSFSSGRTLLVEAGTGTGKTFAYIAPALLERKRLVIATATRTLQDQLISKDLPQLMGALDQVDRSAVNLKGAGNYLCKHKFDQLNGGQLTFRELGSTPQRKLLAVVADWASATETGDFAELDDVAPSDSLLSAISGAGDMCHGTRCQLFNQCHVTIARRRAQDADIVVTNLALYLANLRHSAAGAGSLLPEHDAVVFDEAHQLESFASSAFSVEISPAQVRRLVRNLRIAGNLAKLTWNGHRTLDEAAARFFARLSRYVEGAQGAAADGPYQPQLAIDAGAHTGFVDYLADAAQELDTGLRIVAGFLSERIETDDRQFDPFAPVLESVNSVSQALGLLLGDYDPRFVLHLPTDRRGNHYLQATPLSVADVLREQLFDPDSPGPAIILTSATLAVDGGFGFTRSRLGVDRADEIVIQSPFDFSRQTLLFVPKSLPPPSQGVEGAGLKAYVDLIVKLAQGCPGGVFVLCTSTRRMRDYHRLTECRLPDRLCLLQGDSPTGALLRRFRRANRPVLFATKGFWQGVDVRGTQLSLVIIDRLPFPSPSDPVYAARCDALGRSWFFELALPLAAIDLKQGFGRLIRSSTDRGALALLENRITDKSYGKVILGSLPSIPVTGDIAEVKAHFSGR